MGLEAIKPCKFTTNPFEMTYEGYLFDPVERLDAKSLDKQKDRKFLFFSNRISQGLISLQKGR